MAVFLVCAANVGNSVIFSLLLEQHFHRVKASSAFHPAVSRLGVQKELGGTQPGQSIPADQRDIPHHMASCSAVKPGGRGAGVCCSGTGSASFCCW